MPEYRRFDAPGGTWFFTLVSKNRRPVLVEDHVRTALRDAIVETRRRFPFEIDAWVLLPDHMHCLWTLPEGDTDFSKRWSMIKRLTTQGSGFVASRPNSRMEGGLWQRRFWRTIIFHLGVRVVEMIVAIVDRDY